MFSHQDKKDFCNNIQALYGVPYLSLNKQEELHPSYGSQKEQKQFRSLTRYVDALFDKHSRLLVIRVDFKYRSSLCASIEKAYHDLDHFLNNKTKNPLCKHLPGYIWKSEESSNEGLHFHWVFFFDNAHVQNEWYYATALGQYWQEVITKGRGAYYVAPKNQPHPFLATGVVHRNDVQKRLHLMNIIAYLCKSHQTLTNRPSKARVIGYGQIK